MKPGVTLNPATPLASVEEIITDVDLLLVMSVNPGFGGQYFIPGVLQKIAEARRLIDRRRSRAALEVDGGVKVENAREIIRAGVDILVAGSAIFKSDDYGATIRGLRGSPSSRRPRRRAPGRRRRR